MKVFSLLFVFSLVFSLVFCADRQLPNNSAEGNANPNDYATNLMFNLYRSTLLTNYYSTDYSQHPAFFQYFIVLPMSPFFQYAMPSYNLHRSWQGTFLALCCSHPRFARPTPMSLDEARRAVLGAFSLDSNGDKERVRTHLYSLFKQCFPQSLPLFVDDEALHLFLTFMVSQIPIPVLQAPIVNSNVTNDDDKMDTSD